MGVTAAAVAALVAVAGTDSYVDPAKAKAAAAAANSPPAATLGSKETAKWSATTWEAASSEANKKVLESGEVETVTGEVVDVSCYLQLGKRGEAHVACGSKCIANGQPIGILEADGDLYLLMAEEHHPRRDGEVELKTVFGPWLAKTVTVTGIEVEKSGYKALFVQAAELGGTVKAPAPTTK
jgi:hypothetical protein